MPRRDRRADPNDQFRIALEILAKRGHVVGEITEIAGEPYVTVDGELRTYEQVLGLVEDYNRKRT